jgi:hypothetical protein
MGDLSTAAMVRTDFTSANKAELIGISERQMRRWRKPPKSKATKDRWTDGRGSQAAGECRRSRWKRF